MDMDMDMDMDGWMDGWGDGGDDSGFREAGNEKSCFEVYTYSLYYTPDTLITAKKLHFWSNHIRRRRKIPPLQTFELIGVASWYYHLDVRGVDVRRRKKR